MDRLTDIKMGRFARVREIDGAAPLKIKRRLLELGFTSGQNVRIFRKSLIGQTVLIELRGYCLSMRKNLAALIWTE